jgi:hypothetical protein
LETAIYLRALYLLVRLGPERTRSGHLPPASGRVRVQGIPGLSGTLNAESLQRFEKLTSRQRGLGLEGWLKVETVAALVDLQDQHELTLHGRGPDIRLDLRLNDGRISIRLELKASND